LTAPIAKKQIPRAVTTRQVRSARLNDIAWTIHVVPNTTASTTTCTPSKATNAAVISPEWRPQ
jgi:hypothetical protein